MTTTLRMFYARALFLLVFLFLAFMTAFMGVAFAQEAGTTSATAEPDTKDVIDLLFSSGAAAAAWFGAIVMGFLARYVPSWLMPIFDYITTTEAKHWEDLTNTALDRAEAYARTKYDALKDRAGYINAMATFLAMFNRELVSFADKNGNGIIDLIETRLPPAPPTTEAPQAFLKPVPGAPKPRVPNAVLERYGKIKGATKQ